MTSKTRKTQMCAISAAAAAILMVTGVARADDGDGGELLPIAYVGSDDAGVPASCADQREAATFEVEMKRTDGDVTPEASPITCRNEIYAQVEGEQD